MIQKVIKFVKDNLVAVVGIAAIVISLLLMLLPGQFAHLQPADVNPLYSMNAYEFFFNTKVVDGKTWHPGSITPAILPNEAIALPAGITIFVLMVLTIVTFVFYKKSSALLLLAGLLEVVTSVFFFAMEANADKVYGLKWTDQGVIQWVSYVCGALLIIAGAYAIYKAIMIMKDEIKHPQASSSKTPTYNYLKK